MSWKKLLATVTGLLIAAAAGAGGLWWSLFQSPDFYRTVLEQERRADPVARKAEAKRFVHRTMKLVDDIRHSDAWSQDFTEDEINAWLAEELQRKFGDWLPPGVSEPRVHIESDAIHVGFQYEEPGQWSGVVSLRVLPWINEPNQLALQFESIRAGLVPVPVEQIVEGTTEHARASGWQVEWQQHDGYDVALIRLATEKEPSAELDGVELRDGSLHVHGRARLAGPIEFEPVRVAGHSVPDTTGIQ